MRYVLAVLLPPVAALVYGGLRPFLINLSLCIADLLLCNLGFIVTYLYFDRIAPVIIDFINIFPSTSVSYSINIIPSFNIFFLLAIIHAIMTVVKRDKDKKEANMREKTALWQKHQELRQHSQLRTRRKANQA